MTTLTALPTFEDSVLTNLTPAELIDLILANEDRVPRNLIDECARRGEAMLDVLAPWAHPVRQRQTDHMGHWWLRLHAVMILGLMPGERAGVLLVEFIHGLCDAADENLQEWFGGCWPALLRNKPGSITPALRAICLNRHIDWYMRVNVLEAVLDAARRDGEAELEAALDWTAQFAADETEDREMRLMAADDLLDFPRARHRSLLEKLAAIQEYIGRHFDTNDIDAAFARGTDAPDWERFDNPWQFYEAREIEKRQQRWQKEDAADGGDEFDYGFEEPYVREISKIGRNDPCPCGSGKKYKKCCLGKAGQ